MQENINEIAKAAQKYSNLSLIIKQENTNMQTIRFNKNWNSKLNGTFFTTFRINYPNHCKGQLYNVELSGTSMGRCVCVDKKVLKLSQVNDWIAALDTGTDADSFRKIIEDIYSEKVADIENQEFCLLLMKYI